MIENKSWYLFGVHHSAFVNVKGSHLQHGVVGRAEGIRELVLSQLLPCVLNHTLAASLSIQVSFDLQQIVNSSTNTATRKKVVDCNLHCPPLALYHTWPCADFVSLSVWDGKGGRRKKSVKEWGEGKTRGRREEGWKGRGSKLVDVHLSVQWWTYKHSLSTSPQIGLQ